MKKWKVYRTGEMMHSNPAYNISPERVNEEYLIDHMSCKTWCNMADFMDALEEAKRVTNILKITKTYTISKDYCIFTV